MEHFCFESLDELDHLFRKLVRKYVKERDKILIEDVSLPAFLILRSISSSGDQRLSQLAEELDMTSGAITALCDRLESNGYAERIRSKEDRRIIYLTITEQGIAFAKRYDHLGRLNREILFRDFSEEQIVQQIELFSILLSNIEGLSEKLLLEVDRTDQQEERFAVGEKQTTSDNQLKSNNELKSNNQSQSKYLNY